MYHSSFENARKLRKEMTREERHLWYDFLRGYPVRFMRQRPIGPYIVDFYCAKAAVVIELDGSQHYSEEGIDSDQKRDCFFTEHAIHVIRIPNTEIHSHFDSVCEMIDLTVRNRLRETDVHLPD